MNVTLETKNTNFGISIVVTDQNTFLSLPRKEHEERGKNKFKLFLKPFYQSNHQIASKRLKIGQKSLVKATLTRLTLIRDQNQQRS